MVCCIASRLKDETGITTTNITTDSLLIQLYFLMNLDLIKTKINSKTKGILFVNLYGSMPNMDLLQSIADEYCLWIIEDGAQSFGSSYKGHKSCSCK